MISANVEEEGLTQSRQLINTAMLQTVSPILLLGPYAFTAVVLITVYPQSVDLSNVFFLAMVLGYSTTIFDAVAAAYIIRTNRDYIKAIFCR